MSGPRSKLGRQPSPSERRWPFGARTSSVLVAACLALGLLGGGAFGAVSVLTNSSSVPGTGGGGITPNAITGSAPGGAQRPGSQGQAAGSDVASSARSSEAASSATSTGSAVPAVELPGGWLPNSDGYNDVSCATSTRCIAVGGTAKRLGLIALSTNSGSSWSTPSVPSGQSVLNAISCLSTLRCVAVGQEAALTSTNGGSTWVARTLPLENMSLLSVTCQLDLSCVAVGVVTQVARPYAGVILHSANGGDTWQLAKLPMALPGLGAVTCSTLLHCVAVGAASLVSDDAGLTWRLTALDGGLDALTSVACSTATHCTTVGPNGEAEFTPSLAAISTTSADGGSTWKSLALPSGSGLLSHLDCNGQVCNAIGSGLSDQDQSLLASSANGGTTWAIGVAPPGVSVLAAIACPTASRCLTIGRAMPKAGGSPTVAISLDNRTWTLVQLPTP